MNPTSSRHLNGLGKINEDHQLSPALAGDSSPAPEGHLQY